MTFSHNPLNNAGKKTRELPEKISPGDELEVQLAPYGDFHKMIHYGAGRAVPLVQSRVAHGQCGAVP